MIAPNAKETLIQIQTLSYLDKCSLDYGSLKANFIAAVRSAAVAVCDSTSRHLESMPLASLGSFATTEVLRQPQPSFVLIASAKRLHQPLSFLDTVYFDNPTATFLTTLSPKCAAAFTLTKATSTTTCRVFLLSVAPTSIPA